jgi:hypothetical protein
VRLRKMSQVDHRKTPLDGAGRPPDQKAAGFESCRGHPLTSIYVLVYEIRAISCVELLNGQGHLIPDWRANPGALPRLADAPAVSCGG